MSEDLVKYFISNSQMRVDKALVAEAMQKLPGGERHGIEECRRALCHSMVIGAYEYADRNVMLGFLRVVTDHATFASITDVFVREHLRKNGIGSRLMKSAIEHPSVGRSVCVLQARPHLWPFYNRFGFHVHSASGIMVRSPIK